MSITLSGENGVSNSSWTNGGRPASPGAGQQGFNTTTGFLEYWNGYQWYSDGNPIAASFEFKNEGGVLYPKNKTKVTFVPTNALQTFTVPAGVTFIYAKLWGAGGAGGNTGGWSYASVGGAGGHSCGLIPVTPGEILYIIVGVAGQTNYTGATVPRYGGGGGFVNNVDNRYCGSGGGYCGIFRTVNITQANALLIAGGGGGGGAGIGIGYLGSWGGAGGGTVGQSGGSPYDALSGYAGKGGTQTAGGALGTSGVATNVGTALAGGTGGVATGPYGGSGGGGYWGGSGGGYNAVGVAMAGGGGGSGFTADTNLIGAVYCGAGRIPAFSHDNDLPKSFDSYNIWQKYGWGGDGVVSTAQYTSTGGGGGFCAIYY